jgi:hypothetical protein
MTRVHPALTYVGPLCLVLAGLVALPVGAQSPVSSTSPSTPRSSPMNPTARARLPDVVPAPAAGRDGQRDFDFLHGTWRVHNRRLRRPLTGSGEWYEFEGSTVERPIWDGQANLEEYEATLPDGRRLRGLALRLYDVRAKRWTIHWSNSVSGTLDAAMTGTFRDGRGEFYSHEDFQGRMILVRFYWTSPGPNAARWEQAFSADGGRSWETNWIMEFTRTGEAAAARGPAPTGAVTPATVPAPCCPVVELRHYTLKPGARDTLIELFDREFVESQEGVGMRVIAQFRDIDRPDAFTWLRGFPDMVSRAASLTAFYDGPVWRAHKARANGTMIDSDNVRLLRPVRPGSGFVLDTDRPARGATAIPPGLVVATIYTLDPSAAAGFTKFFERTIAPRLAWSGASPIAVFETEPSPNTFPRLPVREGEHAFVWFARFSDLAAYDRAAARLAADRQWTGGVQPALERMLRAPVEVWRLTPTARSRMPR